MILREEDKTFVVEFFELDNIYEICRQTTVNYAKCLGALPKLHNQN